MGQTRALGLGLIAGGGVLAVIVLLWLLVNLLGGQLRAGGFVFGLIPLVVICLPMIGAGIYLLSREKVEAARSAEFERRRRVYEADRLLSERLSGALERQARRLESARLGALPPGAQAIVIRARTRLADLAEAIKTGYSEAAWYDAVKLTADDERTLRQYDDVLLESAHRLDERVDRLLDAPGDADAQAAAAELDAALDHWRQQFNQREDLLWQGRRPPAVAPLERLRTAGALRQGLGPITGLGVGDALSYEGTDYLVDARLTFFAQGQTWTGLRLRDGGERWLLATPGGAELALLEPWPDAPAGTPDTAETAGVTLQRVDAGTATVTLETKASKDDGNVVDYARYRASTGGRVGWIERWRDGSRAYLGDVIQPEDVDVWRRSESLPSP